MSQLVVQNVTKQFPTRGEPLVVLRGVSFELGAGQNVAIVGPSGTGKSTLLHILGTLDRPTSGTVSLGGEDPFALDDTHLASYRNHNIGFVFQDHYLLPQLSVLENVLIPAVAEGRPGAATVQRARELLDRVGLSGRLDHRPAELSGGERQRTALARALVTGPQLLLLDEPVSALDEHTRDAICRELKRINREQRIPVIHVCHSFEEARMVADRIAIMRNGRIILAGHPEQLVNNPRSRYVAEILRLDNILTGHIIHDDGLTYFETNRCRFRTGIDAPPGPATALIKAWQIHPATQAERCDNMVSGRILEISQVPPLTRITLESPVHLAALVPLASRDLADLKPGDTATLAFNADAIQLLKQH